MARIPLNTSSLDQRSRSVNVS